jgi:hypothetical protein
MLIPSSLSGLPDTLLMISLVLAAALAASPPITPDQQQALDCATVGVLLGKTRPTQALGKQMKAVYLRRLYAVDRVHDWDFLTVERSDDTASWFEGRLPGCIAGMKGRGGPRSVFLQIPTEEQSRQLIPPPLSFRGLLSGATLFCRIERDGTLSGCAVLTETPRTYGVGQAALLAAQVTRVDMAQKPEWSGQPVAINMVFDIGGPQPPWTIRPEISAVGRDACFLLDVWPRTVQASYRDQCMSNALAADPPLISAVPRAVSEQPVKDHGPVRRLRRRKPAYHPPARPRHHYRRVLHYSRVLHCTDGKVVDGRCVRTGRTAGRDDLNNGRIPERDDGINSIPSLDERYREQGPNPPNSAPDVNRPGGS